MLYLAIDQHSLGAMRQDSCQEHVVVAPAPNKPIEKGLLGPGLLSAIVVGKYADHLPLFRLEDVFARHGVELPRSTLCRWALQTADILEPLYQTLIGGGA